MKRIVGAVGAAVPALALVGGVALAQQQAPAQPGPMHNHQMQTQCPPMMGGMMGGGMMGMMGGQPDSPKMMQMRGEMMKAMGDIMMKYGKMMEGTSR